MKLKEKIEMMRKIVLIHIMETAKLSCPGGLVLPFLASVTLERAKKNKLSLEERKRLVDEFYAALQTDFKRFRGFGQDHFLVEQPYIDEVISPEIEDQLAMQNTLEFLEKIGFNDKNKNDPILTPKTK